MAKPKAQSNGDGDEHRHDRYEKIKEKLHHLHLEDAKIHLIHQKYVVHCCPPPSNSTDSSQTQDWQVCQPGMPSSIPPTRLPTPR